MIFHTVKELIEQQPNCPICDSSLVAFLKERARNKENIPKKRIYLINSKFKNQQFEFKLNYNSYGIDIDNVAVLSESSIITFTPVFEPNEISNALSVLSNLFLSIEMHCMNRSCKYKYYTITSVLKPEYDSDVGIYLHPFLLDWECFNINHLWIQNDHISQITRIYNINSITTPPITTPFLPISISNKDKTFNRIQTIVNFG